MMHVVMVALLFQVMFCSIRFDERVEMIGAKV